MPSVSRETVLAAVDLYGTAWTTQDPEKIASLFTQDAVYVERAFDRKATFRGRQAISKYWKYQICGKQSNIAFRHVASEMVRDADQPIAVVKWLAEFDNIREKRSQNKTHKRVRFSQMAKLIFKGDQVAYLEEYAQAMGGSGVRWPGLTASENELWRQIRFDPPPPPSPVQCERCLEFFSSRTKLFAHLKATEARSDGKLGCVPNLEARNDSVLICFSVTYSSADLATQQLEQALQSFAQQELKLLEGNYSEETVSTITWAVPPELSCKAIVNVAVTRQPSLLVSRFSMTELQDRLNAILALQNPETCFQIHTSCIVDRMLVSERREFERYIVFVPWTLLNPSTVDSPSSAWTTQAADRIGSESNKLESLEKPLPTRLDCCWRAPLEETSAAEYVSVYLSQRIKRGARILSENIPAFRVRTGTMLKPWHRWCRVVITTKQTKSGTVEHLVGWLLAHARGDLTDGDLGTVAQDGFEAVGNKHSCKPYCSEFVCLQEPFLANFETKIKAGLCRDGIHASDELKASIDRAENRILEEIEQQEYLLDGY